MISINKNRIENYRRPYVIAEMACAHDGDYEKAIRIIDAAIEAEADAIQLQFFIPESTVTPNHPVYETLKKIAFSREQWQKMVQYVRSKKNIDVWVCTYDYPSVAWAKEMNVDGIKLNSSDLSNPELLEAVAQTGIPFTIGTGASYMEEVRAAIQKVEHHGAQNFVLVHGVQNFPTAIEDVQINRVDILKNNFPGYLIGYADHTDAELEEKFWMDTLAIAKGVAVLEKHITWDRSEKGIDHQAALNPDEFKQYVSNVNTAYKALGSRKLEPLDASDFKYRKFQKKSIVAAKDLQEGDVLTRNDILFLRNDIPGLSPREWENLEGKMMTKNLSKFQNILNQDVR